MRTAVVVVVALALGCRGIGRVDLEATMVVYREPPAPRVVPAPAARKGFVWVSGHWEAIGADWHWIDGHFEPARAGYLWTDGRWERRGNAWHWVYGTWTTEPLGGSGAP